MGDPRREGYRSQGEAQIARLLDRYRIDYLYEHPLAVVDGGKVRVWYPDFQLRGYGMVIEYCGRPDDPRYREGMMRKEQVYHDNGVSALMLRPETFRGNWPERVLGQIEGVLVDRLARFRGQRQYDMIRTGRD